MKSIILLVILFLFAGTVCAQDSVTIGRYRTIESKILGGKVTYMEHLPDGYKESNKEYPVIVMMNGHIIPTFGNAAATIDNLSGDRIPDMILIGIGNEGVAQNYWACPNDSGIVEGGEKFHRFLQEELLPEIKKSYRTNGYTILSGQSNTGLYVMYNFLFYPELFSAYIVASPMFGWCPDFFLNKTKLFLAENPALSKKFYIAYGDIDYAEVLDHINDFRELLKRAPESLKWRIDRIENTGHVPFITMNNALLFFFSECTLTPAMRKLSVTEINSHYERLSKEYGFTVQPKYDALFDIAINLKMAKKFDEAIVRFKHLISLYPDAQAYFFLGHTYQQKGDIELAKECYSQSLKLDSSYENARRALEQFNK